MTSRLMVFIFAVVGVLLLLVPAASAVDLFKPCDTATNGGKNSAVCIEEKKTGNPISGPNGVINKAAGIVAIVAGIASVILVIIAGLKFITANGDSSKIANARSTLIYAAVGLVITAIAGSIVAFLADNLFK